jgi:hypothetical protein
LRSGQWHSHDVADYQHRNRHALLHGRQYGSNVELLQLHSAAGVVDFFGSDGVGIAGRAGVLVLIWNSLDHG